MIEIATTLTWAAVVALGLSAGALVAEGAVLVPFWRSLQAGEFLAWYERHANLLLRFFGPLEIAAVVLPLLASGLSWITGRPGAAQLALATVLSVGVLVAFPLYFRNANASFATGSLGERNVPRELARWSRWHWARTALAVAAFGASIPGF